MSGIDSGVYSNATALTERKAEQLLPHLTFLRCSFNGGDRETYAAVHGTSPKHFDLALKNLQRAVSLREQNGWAVTLGMQIVLLPENIDSLVPLARIAAELGIDYLAVKPFVQHPEQQNRRWENYRLEEIEEVVTEAEGYSRTGFRVLVRRESFRSSRGERAVRTYSMNSSLRPACLRDDASKRRPLAREAESGNGAASSYSSTSVDSCADWESSRKARAANRTCSISSR